MDWKQFGILMFKRWPMNSNFLAERLGKGRTSQVKQKHGVRLLWKAGDWWSVCRGQREVCP